MTRDYLMTIAEVVGIVQSIFLAIALWYLPGNHQHANRWLGSLFLIFALQFAHMVVRQNDLLYLAPSLALLRLPLNFLYGPLLYLYLRQITQPWEARRVFHWWPHFLMFIAAALFCLPVMLLDHHELLHMVYYGDLVRVYDNIPALNQMQQWLWIVASRILTPAFALHLLAYLWLDLGLLIQHKHRVRQHFSRLDRISLDWMRHLLLALAAICLVVALRSFLFGNGGIGRLLNDLLQVALVLFVSALGIFGLLQKSIPLPAPHATAAEATEVQPAPSAAKYQSSSLTDESLTDGLNKLKTFMDNTRPWLDSELTLTALSAQIGIPARHLSQIINGNLRQNFLDFVNSYRVEEAKRLLGDRSYTSSILDIAMDAGFNSKSAFYTAFKRNTGQTPTSYRQNPVAAAEMASTLNRT